MFFENRKNVKQTALKKRLPIVCVTFWLGNTGRKSSRNVSSTFTPSPGVNRAAGGGGHTLRHLLLEGPHAAGARVRGGAEVFPRGAVEGAVGGGLPPVGGRARHDALPASPSCPCMGPLWGMGGGRTS